MARVLASRQFVLGPELDAFEREFAAYCGAGHCIGVGNGLEAISLLLRAYGIGAGDEVVVPAHTFVATWLGVSETGATPVPVAVDEATANLDPARIAAVLTPRTRAIMPVHLYGQPADMDSVRELAADRGLRVLEDAAQAHGARWRGERTGNLADGAAFSFYPGKNLGALGDAGAITCEDDGVAERCRALRNYGSPRKYVHETIGVNSRLDELQAAVLRVKLAHLDRWNERRRVIAGRYLRELEGVALPRVQDGAESVWHLFVIRAPDRDGLARRLSAAGVETLVHYPVAPHETGAYAGLATDPDQVAAAARLARTVLSLPIGPHLGDADVGRVIAAVRTWSRRGEASDLDARRGLVTPAQPEDRDEE
jgi:dTDP-3-amino-3,4,6-trideoxy-alpha-D-glucose transaminase